jgi:hypothetical protein
VGSVKETEPVAVEVGSFEEIEPMAVEVMVEETQMVAS